jgi:hypothetical protein
LKLISKFRDYYDSVSHQYLDKEIKYIREQYTIQVDNKRSKSYPKVVNDGARSGMLSKNPLYRFTISGEIIGFCGYLYPLIRIREYPSDKVLAIFYNYDNLKKWVNDLNFPIKNGKPGWFWRDGFDLGYLNECKRYFEERKNWEALENKFFELNTPCFLYKEARGHDCELQINPKLKDYRFAGVKDPFTAHQELYQFVGGYLNQPVNKTVTISDLDKIAKHGFDKWSFRQKGPKK